METNAKRIPRPCFIVIVSPKKNIAMLIVKTGYKADNVTIIESGPLLTA